MTNGSTSSTSNSRAIMIVLSYLWILALVPLLVEKRDPDIQWHAKHGLILLAAEIVLWGALSIIVMILGAVTSVLSCFVAVLLPGVWLAIVVVHVIAIVKGLNGERLLIPGISEYTTRL